MRLFTKAGRAGVTVEMKSGRRAASRPSRGFAPSVDGLDRRLSPGGAGVSTAMLSVIIIPPNSNDGGHGATGPADTQRNPRPGN